MGMHKTMNSVSNMCGILGARHILLLPITHYRNILQSILLNRTQLEKCKLDNLYKAEMIVDWCILNLSELQKLNKIA